METPFKQPGSGMPGLDQFKRDVAQLDIDHIDILLAGSDQIDGFTGAVKKIFGYMLDPGISSLQGKINGLERRVKNLLAKSSVQEVQDNVTQETKEVEIYVPQGDGTPPKACLCSIPVDFDLSGCVGTCGTIAFCDPVTHIIIRCAAYNCGSPVPPGWCYLGGVPPIVPPPPPPDEPPYPQPPPTQPPPEEECCPQQVIQVMCDGNAGSTVCPPDKERECEDDGNGDIPPIIPFGDNSQSGKDIPICFDTTKCTDIRLVSKQPFPLARDGKGEPASSECGLAKFKAAYGDDDKIDKYTSFSTYQDAVGDVISKGELPFDETGCFVYPNDIED